MNINDAKEALKILRGSKTRADFMDEALDIALWLCDWHAAIKAGVDMIAWEKEHPRS